MMKQITVRGGWIAALAALCALVVPAAASAAVHSLPEAGRCVRVANGAGAYRGSTCLKLETGRVGKFEWIPVTEGEKQTFTGSGSEPTVLTVGHSQLHCTVANITGEYTSPKTAKVEIEFQGCENGSGAQCQNSQAKKTEIKSLPLEAELGFIKSQVPGLTVGLDIKPKSPSTALAIYECGSLTETARIEGSVIAKITPIDKMTTLSNLLFKVTRAGEQVPQSFEGMAKDTLSTTFMSGVESTTAPSTLSMLGETGTNANALEIKALES